MSIGSPSVPAGRPVRPSWPSLKMITPTAPAALALLALRPKSHVPRWISAMLPAVKPAKSAAVQPAGVVPGSAGGGIVMPRTACTFAVTSPLPEYSNVSTV